MLFGIITNLAKSILRSGSSALFSGLAPPLVVLVFLASGLSSSTVTEPLSSFLSALILPPLIVGVLSSLEVETSPDKEVSSSFNALSLTFSYSCLTYFSNSVFLSPFPQLHEQVIFLIFR